MARLSSTEKTRRRRIVALLNEWIAHAQMVKSAIEQDVRTGGRRLDDGMSMIHSIDRKIDRWCNQRRQLDSRY